MVGKGEGRSQAQSVVNLLELFIGPLEGWLDDQLDRHLVRTSYRSLGGVVKMIAWRVKLLLRDLNVRDGDMTGTHRRHYISDRDLGAS